MEEVKLNVRALSAIMKTSIAELANMADISEAHLKDVSAGRTKMTARDLIQLSKVTGVNPFNIEVGE